MAGDWIKMTHALPEKPEVLEIAGRTSLSRFEVVGRLFILWRWFDTNTVDGNARGVTKVTLNACLFGYSDDANFVSAVVDARWLRESEDGIGVINFDEHISESAKTRAQTAKRVAKSKAGKGNAKGNGKSVTKSVPKEEKRREEESIAKEELSPADFEIPDWVPADAWIGWVEMRKKNKKPPTYRALELAVADLKKLKADGNDPAAVLNQSTMRNYAGLFEVAGGSTAKPNWQAEVQ